MSFRFHVCIALLMAGLVAGCSALAPEPTATPTPEPTATLTATATLTETPRPSPTNTSTPTVTPSPTPLPPELVFSLEPSEVIERRNLEVELIRLVIGEKEALTSGHPQLDEEDIPSFPSGTYADSDVLVMVEFRITNQSGREIFFFPQDMYVVMGGRQASLEDFIFGGEVFGDPFVGEVRDTVTVRTGTWVGVSGVDLAEVEKITFTLGQAWVPTFGNTIEQFAGGFTFELDLAERSYRPPTSDDG